MQLSTSTLPLDPVLAATAGSSANPGATAGIAAPADGEATPEFSSLLSSESEGEEATPDQSAPSPFAPELLNLLARDPATPPAAEPTAMATWLAANGFTPAAAEAAAGELTEGSNDISATVEPSTNPAVRTPGRESAGTAFVGPENSPRAIARAYALAATRNQESTTGTATGPVAIPADAELDETGGFAVPASAPASRSGETMANPVTASVGERAEPDLLRANTERGTTATPVETRRPYSSFAPTSFEVAALPENGTDALVADTVERPLSSYVSAQRERAAFASLPQSASSPAKPVEVLSSIRGDVVAEKFAAHAEQSSGESAKREGRGEKHSLSSERELLTSGSSVLGINVAKPETLMPALATPPTASPSLAGVEHLSPAPASFDSLFSQAEQETPELAQAARRSVDSAMAVAERFVTGDKRAVTLQFSVSGVDLGVHVELRGDGVHTTFRTDSPELRAALAQEWQAVAGAQPGDRSSRFADPVFTSTPNGNSQSDANGADQRGSNPRQDRQFASDFAALNIAPRASSSASTAPAAIPGIVRAAPLSTSNRLHTFA